MKGLFDAFNKAEAQNRQDNLDRQKLHDRMHEENSVALGQKMIDDRVEAKWRKERIREESLTYKAAKLEAENKILKEALAKAEGSAGVRLEAENEILKQALARAEGLARTKLLECKGLADTILHLHRAWHGDAPKPTGPELTALANKMRDEADTKPDYIAAAEATIDRKVRPTGNVPRVRRST